VREWHAVSGWGARGVYKRENVSVVYWAPSVAATEWAAVQD
jgi:hypothetical protein